MKAKEIYQEEFVEFLGALRAANAKHFLKIHHDYSVDKIGKLIGHFYVELHDAITNTSILRGKNPKEKSFIKPANCGEVIDELARITQTKEYMKEMDDIILTTKVIPLTEQQYTKTMRFINEYTCKVYAAGINDCASYAQAVYNAAGLPRHFTDVYSSEELSILHGLATFSVHQRFGSKDTNIIVGGFSEEEVAQHYNVELGRVIDTTEMLAAATPTTRPSKQYVILNEKVWTQASALSALGHTEDSPAPQEASHEWLIDIIQNSLKVFGNPSVAEEQAIRREAQESMSFGLELQRQAVGMFGLDIGSEGLHEKAAQNSGDSSRTANTELDVLTSVFTDMVGGVFEEAEAMSRNGPGVYMPFGDPSATALRQVIGRCGFALPNLDDQLGDQ